MALDQLLEVLRREGDAEAGAIVAAAEAEAAALRNRTTADLSHARERLEEELDDRRRVEVEQALTLARREARRAVLEARAGLLDDIFERARSRLAAASETQAYRDRLPTELAQALACLGERQGSIHCHPAIRSELQALLPAGSRVALIPDLGPDSGFRLHSDDGRVVIDATLEGRMARSARHLRQQVAAALEGDS